MRTIQVTPATKNLIDRIADGRMKLYAVVGDAVREYADKLGIQPEPDDSSMPEKGSRSPTVRGHRNAESN